MTANNVYAFNYYSIFVWVASQNFTLLSIIFTSNNYYIITSFYI